MNVITIFTVDDYLLTRITHKKYFSNRKEFSIIGDFALANECIEKLKLTQPDVILMDVEMPDMDGIEAAKIIKEKYPKIKVIIFTSFVSKEQVLSALASGACGYVLKNPDVELDKIIKTVMEGSFFMDLEIACRAFSSISSSSSDEDYIDIDSLTQRELEVLRLMTLGKTNPEIASEMIVSINTAKAHVGKILSKLEVNDRVQAVVKAIRAKIL